MPDRILDSIELPEGAGKIVLCDWMSEQMRDGRNVVRTDGSGNVLWRAVPPQSGDCFTAIQWDGESLTANTWSGYLVRLSVPNGGIETLHFTK